MELARDDLEAAVFLASRFVNAMKAQGRPVNHVIENFRLKVTLMWEMSRVGHQSVSDEAEFDTWLPTSQAAQELKLSTRHTRRLKADLDGEFFNGRLMFRESKVRAYAEGKRDG